MRKKILSLGLLAGAAFAAGATDASASAFTWPTTGMMTSTYYSSRSYGIHGAIDIAAGTGSWIGAARGGCVSFRGWSGGYGNLVIMNHSSGYQTYYAHQSRFGAGGCVGNQTIIGYVGSTGHSTGPHVHFEIRRYGAKQYIPGSYGWRVSRGAGINRSYPGL